MWSKVSGYLYISLTHGIVNLQSMTPGFPSMPIGAHQSTGEVSCMSDEKLHPREALLTASTTGEAEGPLACSKIPGCWPTLENHSRFIKIFCLLRVVLISPHNHLGPKRGERHCRNLSKVSYCYYRSLSADTRCYRNTGQWQGGREKW